MRLWIVSVKGVRHGIYNNITDANEEAKRIDGEISSLPGDYPPLEDDSYSLLDEGDQS